MNTVPEKEIIFFRESLIQSVLADISTIGLLLAGFFINRFYLHEKWYIYIFLMILFLIIAGSRSSKKTMRFTSKKELVDYLERKAEEV